MVKIAVSIKAKNLDLLVNRVKWVLSSYDERVITEARLDYLHEINLDSLFEKLSPLSNRLIITYRRPDEGGVDKSYNIGKARKIFLKLKEMKPLFIDIELRTINEIKEEIDTNLIISKHYIGDSPTLRSIVEDVKECLKLGDIAKIVTYPKVFGEAVELLKLYKLFEPSKIVAFSAGSPWNFTRFLSLALGSPLIYASIPGEAVAPGQPTVDEALQILEVLKA